MEQRREDASSPPQVDSEAPHPLNYGASDTGLPLTSRLRVWHGLVLGFALSVLWWFGGINSYFHNRLGFGLFGGMVVLAFIKFGAATAALIVPRWRRFGAGILLSIGLVVLIFVGTCFAILSGLKGLH